MYLLLSTYKLKRGHPIVVNWALYKSEKKSKKMLHGKIDNRKTV